MKSFDLYLILYIIIICCMLASDGKLLKNVSKEAHVLSLYSGSDSFFHLFIWFKQMPMTYSFLWKSCGTKSELHGDWSKIARSNLGSSWGVKLHVAMLQQNFLLLNHYYKMLNAAVCFPQTLTKHLPAKAWIIIFLLQLFSRLLFWGGDIYMDFLESGTTISSDCYIVDPWFEDHIGLMATVSWAAGAHGKKDQVLQNLFAAGGHDNITHATSTMHQEFCHVLYMGLLNVIFWTWMYHCIVIWKKKRSAICSKPNIYVTANVEGNKWKLNGKHIWHLKSR